MENFFIEDTFYSDLGDYIDDLFLDEDKHFYDLDDDWSIEAERSKLERIFTLKEDFVLNAILNETDTWEERFPEDCDIVFEKIKKSIKESIDIEKMNEGLPKLYYPNGETFVITKEDLIRYSL